MLRHMLLSTALLLALPFASQGAEQESKSPPAVSLTYANLVLENYKDALEKAKILQKKINAFLDKPTESRLKAAKDAWIEARNPYSETESFRFYEGPIDFADAKTGESGPEGELNAWPLNEAYIDYVREGMASGIILDSAEPITEETLAAKNQQRDEKDVSTGYHAIEFLLWGQDESKDGPGTRPITDYIPANPSAKRRGEYLKTVTDLLVKDLETLVAAWEPEHENYRAQFLALPQNEAVGKMLTGVASLASAEMAGERMNNSLISGDQEDEQSCFSDTTTNDFTHNFQGIANVYLGRYGSVSGASISDLVKEEDKKLDEEVREQIKSVASLIAAIPSPYDQILATPEDSKERETVKKTTAALQDLAELLQKAGKTVGSNVVIVSE